MNLYMTEVIVANFPEALAWFRDVLGMSADLIDTPREFALLRAGEASIGLTARKAGSSVVLPRLTFLVDDLEAESARLRTLGVVVTDILEDQAERFRSVRLEGPEAIPITLFAWYS